MKNRVSFLIAVVFALSILCGGYGSAQEGKIVFVDVQKLMTLSQKAKTQQDKFQDAMKKKTAELDKMRQDAAKLSEEIKNKGPMLNEEKQVAMLKAMKYKEIDFQIAEQQIQAYAQDQKQEIQKVLLQELQQVISAMQKKHNYKLVLNGQALLAAEDAIDITDLVAKEYDAYKPAAAPRPAAGPAAPTKPATPAKPAAPTKPADKTKR